MSRAPTRHESTSLRMTMVHAARFPDERCARVVALAQLAGLLLLPVTVTRALAPTYPCSPCEYICQHGFCQNGFRGHEVAQLCCSGTERSNCSTAPLVCLKCLESHNFPRSGSLFGSCDSCRRCRQVMDSLRESIISHGEFEIVQGKRTDWDYVHELVTKGKTVYEIVSLVPLTYPHVMSIREMVNLYIQVLRFTSSVKLEPTQRRLAWPLGKDDAHKLRSVNNVENVTCKNLTQPSHTSRRPARRVLDPRGRDHIP